MKSRDIALAVAISAIWGVNFVVIHVGLARFPPILFSALRFGVAAVPAVFFVGRPQVLWRWVLAVGLSFGVVQFSLLFAGMAAGMPAGLSSLVLQCQAVFTVVFALALLRERLSWRQGIGMALALGGLALVSLRIADDVPVRAFALVVAAGAAWGVSNIAMRKAAAPDMLRFMVWVSAAATPFLVVLSLLVDGPATDFAALRTVDLTALGAIGFVAGPATLFGFGAWGVLIGRYGAAAVSPLAMLAPFFGVVSGALVLDERLGPSDVVGGAAIVGGVLLSVVRRPSARAVDGATCRRSIAGIHRGSSTIRRLCGPDGPHAERRSDRRPVNFRKFRQCQAQTLIVRPRRRSPGPEAD